MDNSLRADLENNRPVRVRPLCKEANRSPNHVYSAIARGEIRSIRVGRAIRIPADEARRLLGLEAA